MVLVKISILLILSALTPKISTKEPIPETKWGGKYDFVIIGGGTSGLILASRLSEVKNWKILILEAGEEPPYFSNIPLAAPSMVLTSANWGFLSEPDNNTFEGFIQRQMAWPSGKVLGGSSSINYMIYSRGNEDDFKKLKSLGWGFDDVLPYFLKNEESRLPVFDLGYHNLSGLMAIDFSYNGEEVEDFLKAAKQLGHNTTDYNGKNQIGFSTIQAFLKKGARESTYTATIKKSSPLNLEVVTRAIVTKIAFDKNASAVKNVKFTRDGRRYRVQATKEYLLCAGTFGSPKILLLSGIGSSNHLKSFKIPVVKNLTAVGENLGDHITYPGLNFLGNYNKTQFDIAKDTVEGAPVWYMTGQGPLASLGGFEALGFVKLATSPQEQKYPDLEILFQNTMINPSMGKMINLRPSLVRQLYNNTENLIQFTILPILLHPKSRGCIRLQSKNPFDAPLLYPKYLSTSQDVTQLIEGIKWVLGLSKTKAFRNKRVKLNPNAVPECRKFKMGSDDYWACAVKVLATTAFDPFGTCRMGLENDTNAVVTPKLKVKDVKNLRVVDASVIPDTISGNLAGVVGMIAERAADFIKQDHLKN